VTRDAGAGPLARLLDGLAGEGWAVVDGLLSEEVLRGLRARLEELEAQGALAPARVGRGEGRQRVAEVRGDLISWLPGPLEVGGAREGLTAAERGLYERVDELVLGLNRRLFLGVRGYELHYARYGEGAGYQRHVDRLRGQPAAGRAGGLGERRVSLVTYLNEGWVAGDGGELCVWAPVEGGGEREALVAPVWGRTVCFESDRFPHAVLPARRARRSVTGWLLG